MPITLTQQSRLPIRRDKQIPVNGEGTTTSITGGGAGGGSTFPGTFDTGSSVNPSITFTIDTATGFYHPNTDQIGVAVGGSEKFLFDADGSFYATADIVGYSTYPSDRRLKDDVEPINNALGVILQLKGIKYTYKADKQKHFGLIAQDVQPILPEVVIEHDLPGYNEKYLTIRYSEIIPYLIECIKNQQEQINDLKKDLKYYTNCLYGNPNI